MDKESRNHLLNTMTLLVFEIGLFCSRIGVTNRPVWRESCPVPVVSPGSSNSSIPTKVRKTSASRLSSASSRPSVVASRSSRSSANAGAIRGRGSKRPPTPHNQSSDFHQKKGESRMAFSITLKNRRDSSIFHHLRNLRKGE